MHQAAAEPLQQQQLVDNSAYYNQQQYPDTFAPTGEGYYDPYAQNFLTQEQVTDFFPYLFFLLLLFCKIFI